MKPCLCQRVMMMKRIDTRLEILEKNIQKIATEHNTHKAIEELEEWHRAIVAKYNSAEEKAKRSREYEELLEVGRLRKMAFDRGEPMSKYPLPWEKVS